MGHNCVQTHLCQHCRVCQLWGKVDRVLLIMAMIARILMTMTMMIRSSKALQWSRQGLQKFWWKWSKAAATLCTSPQKSTLSPQLRTCTIFPNLDHWYRHNANQIYMGYIYLLSRPLVCVLLSAIVYSQLNLNPNWVPMYKIPPVPTTVNLILAQGPT